MTTPRPKYQVFVSSTFADLHKEREAVIYEILKARQIPAGMESFPATDDRGWKVIQRTIDDCDYYVLLVAGRYGTVDKETNLSWTEREYDYAREKGIPVLAFVRAAGSITLANADTDEKVAKLAEFKKKVGSSHLYQEWTTSDDLCSKVGPSLTSAILDAEADGIARPGWIRGNAVPVDALAEIARLSKENSELRARVEMLGDKNKPAFELTLNDVTDPIELKEPIPSYRRAAGTPNNTAQAEYTALAIRTSRTLWLQADVTNTGAAIARNIRAKFTVTSGVEAVDLNKAARKGPLLSQQFISDAHLDPSRDVYVSRAATAKGSALIEQRVKTLGIKQTENLVRMGLVLVEDFFDRGLDIDVRYAITSEDGEATEGTIKIEVFQDGIRTVDREEIAQF
jgi:hypothetical protein